jgi:outer membrane protein OmpA-like peptidoglycan-associated protein
MKKFLASIILLAACGAHGPSKELLQARAAYDQASRSNAATLAPADLHVAKKALVAAERESSDEPFARRSLDLSYIAMRKAQRAEALGNAAAASAAVAAIEAQRVRVQADVIASQQGKLHASENALERQQGELSRQQAELAAKQGEIAAKEGALAQKEAETAAERNARLAAEAKVAEAEKKAKDAMDALGRQMALKEDTRGTVITLSGSVLFVTGKATLLAGATAQLDKVADALTKLPERHFTIEGHTDSTGSYAINADLSARRANAVRDYLISRGVSADAVSAVGVGSQRPVADNKSTAGRAMNRRVEIIVDRATSPNASAQK